LPGSVAPGLPDRTGAGSRSLFPASSVTMPGMDTDAARLLRALGDLQLAPLHDDPSAVARGVFPITDMFALAVASGLAYNEIPPLIAAGIAAGYIAADGAGAVGLTRRGWRWHRWDQEHHRR